jgi:hypothetical protein
MKTNSQPTVTVSGSESSVRSVRHSRWSRPLADTTSVPHRTSTFSVASIRSIR